MARKIVVLDSAKDDFKDIKAYITREFGDSIWNAVSAEFKRAIQRIKENPQVGNPISELKELGITNVRYVLVRQTRVVCNNVFRTAGFRLS